MAKYKKSNAKNIDIEKSFREATKSANKGKYVAKKNRTSHKKLIVGICAGAGAFLILTAVLVFLYIAGFIGNITVKNQVTVGGIPISGMDRDAVEQVMKETITQQYASTDMVVTVDGRNVVLSPAKTGIRLNVSKAATAIFLKRPKDGAFDLSPYLTVDEDAIREALAPLEEPYRNSAFQQSSYEILGEMPVLDDEHVDDPVQTVSIFLGVPDYSFSADDLYNTVIASYSGGNMHAVYQVPAKYPDPIELAAIHNSLYIAPLDAQMDKETFEISQHNYGYGLDTETGRTLLDSAKYGETITVNCVRIPPRVTHDSLASQLFRDVLGQCKAVASSQYNRDVNLRLSCAAINGKILLPGETFAYNSTLGERTPEKGYRPAAGYWGSEIIQSYGGGICQTSSALYYSALLADMQIVERHNHGYLSTYVPYGMDATVDWSGPDFKFKNNTEYPIRIEAYSSGGTVYVKILGTDTKDHYVKMEYSVVKTDPYKTIYKEFPPDNDKGYKDGYVITDPYTGYSINTYRCRYDKATNELISRNLEAKSQYSRRDKVVCKIVYPTPEPTEPEESTPTEPEVTEPSTPGVTEPSTPEVTEPPAPEVTEPPAPSPDEDDVGGNVSPDGE